MLGMWYVLNSLDAIFITGFYSSQAATMLSTGHLVMPPRIIQHRCNVICHLDSDTLLVSSSSKVENYTP